MRGNETNSDPGASSWLDAAASSDVLADAPVEVLAGDTVIVLIRHDGILHAFQGLCPHQFARLQDGRVAEGYINCPRHMAKFRLSDGACGPGWTLPSLRRFAVRETAGRVYVSTDMEVGDERHRDRS